MFDIEGFAQPEENATTNRRADIEIRNFEGVPMANLPAVLPKTKLVFRPADAFLFDMISFVTFFLVLGSVRLDSPRLDLLALVSVTLWTLRTVFRYSNKLARYDLLVKTFLTSKIAHRNAGALRYICSEAGVQRAVRTTLVYYWLLNLFNNVKVPFTRHGKDYLSRSDLLMKGQDDINNMLTTEKQVQLHVEKSLEDLEKLRMIRFDKGDREKLLEVLDPNSSIDAIKGSWIEFFEDEVESDDDRFDGSQKLEIDATSRDNLSSSQNPEKLRGAFEIQSENGLSLADFDERRKRLRASLEQSGQVPRGNVVYEWQRGIAAGGLQPAFEGPSNSLQKNQGERRWYF
jgi:Protein of unknown function (DUF3754)